MPARSTHMKAARFAIVLCIALAACASDGPTAELDMMPAQGDDGMRQCAATHDKVGHSAELSTRSHDVGGIATIVDDCTIRIDMFEFDGAGINVQIYGGLAGNYEQGFSMSEDLRRDTPYSGESLIVQLPEGLDLDDLDGISVWCVPAGADFGSGQFVGP